MTDLQRAELALAVARVVGRKELPVTIVAFGGVRYTVSEPIDKIEERLALGNKVGGCTRIGWDPTQGGAAGAEVLKWADANNMNIQFQERACGLRSCCLRENGEPPPWVGIGPTIWIALCRAVAYGGATDD